MHNRIDEKGQYCAVPGTTVISAICGSDTEFWRTIYNQLKNSSTICRYYAPLPLNSYHMTAIALDTIDDVPENGDWTTFINEKIPVYSKLHEAISKLKIVPNIRFDFLSEVNLIVLAVSLPPEQERAIQELAEQHGRKNGIQSYFHITLAYQYGENPTQEEYDKINVELDSLRRIFEEKKTIKLDPPKLCYFNDMTRFTPWDGATNPFITPPPRPSLFSSVLNSVFGFFLGEPPQLTITDKHSPPNKVVKR